MSERAAFDGRAPGEIAFEAPGVWVWDPRTGAFIAEEPAAEAASGPLLVADSWLVREGRIRAFDRHAERFARACRAAAEEAAARAEAEGGPAAVPESVGAAYALLAALAEQEEFWQRLRSGIPVSGEWFPRIELAAPASAIPASRPESQAASAPGAASSSASPGIDAASHGIEGKPVLRFRLRPAPARADGVSVWVPETPDPRERPLIKGPDIARLGALRAQGVEWHAQDALLCAADGTVVEAAHANLLWWEDDLLCVPDPELGVFSGVTVGLVLEEAERRGIQVRRRRALLTDLLSRDVWLTNALHGLRRVRAWRGPGTEDGVLARHADFVSAELERARRLRFAQWSAWLEAIR
ncbi:aminotransferase class IV [Brevibacterium album]|uniref:aminotransferase class IV n=1 Tax=Brevibacterium album TaxID=417948 RepID=UPI0004120028|nr:aminotransferase class IV [Brevibacterium album]